jgi:alcohol dehydrogenase
MIAAVFGAYGDVNNVVSVRADIPVPTITSDQVLVKVKAAAVNPVDWKMIKGSMEMILSNLWPKGIGFDFSGEIVKVGSSCARIKVGDLVWGMTHFTGTGTCAQYLAIPEKYVGIKPESLDWAEAASVPLVALTSWQALNRQVQVTQGMKVLVLGASGGTGAAAVQIAKSAGAFVAGTCSSKNVEVVKTLVADLVIDYTTQNWWDVLSGQEYDIVYDTVGGYDSWTHSHSVLKKNGNFVTIAGDVQGDKMNVFNITQMVAKVASRKFWSLISTPGYHYFATSTGYEDLNQVKALVDAGKLTALVDSKYPLSKTADALLRNKTMRAVGKVVVEIDL